jgi:hypothetical protein
MMKGLIKVKKTEELKMILLKVMISTKKMHVC